VKYEDVLFFIDACSLKESVLTYPGGLGELLYFLIIYVKLKLLIIGD
jgi:hypothetical protein